MIPKDKLTKIMVDEGQQYRTKMRDGHNGGSRHIRHMVENAIKGVDNILTPYNGFPDPADDSSKLLLGECKESLAECARKLKECKDKNNESI